VKRRNLARVERRNSKKHPFVGAFVDNAEPPLTSEELRFLDEVAGEAIALAMNALRPLEAEADAAVAELKRSMRIA